MSHTLETIRAARRRHPEAALYIDHIDDLRHVLEGREIAAWMFNNKPCLHDEVWEAHEYIRERLNQCGRCDGAGSISTHLVCDPRSEEFTCSSCSGTGQDMDFEEAHEVYVNEGVFITAESWLNSEE